MSYKINNYLEMRPLTPLTFPGITTCLNCVMVLSRIDKSSQAPLYNSPPSSGKFLGKIKCLKEEQINCAP